MLRYSFYLLNLTLFLLLLLPNIPFSIPLWWLDNLLNLQIQWSFLALLLMLTNIIYIKKFRLFITFLHSTLIFINLMPLYLTIPTQAQQEAIKTGNQQQLVPFTIAQLNLSYDNPNLTQLLPVLGDKRFQLLVIQEASDKEYKNIQRLASYYPYSFGLEALQATPSGMAIFSRYPISETHLYDLGYKSGHILEVIIQMPDYAKPIQIYALHPGSPRSKKLWQLRNSTLAVVANKVATSPFVNKIVIGDFNSSPWSHAFKYFQKTSQLKNSAQGFGYIPSWSYHSQPLLSILSSVYIDHSLVSEPFEVLNKYSQAIQGSDHLLLLTELAI